MRQLENRSVDAVITDPPYCSGGSTEATRRVAVAQGIDDDAVRKGTARWFAGDNMTTAGLVWLLRAVAFEAERVLVQGGHLLVFCDWRMWANLAPALESGGLRLQNMVVWDKGSQGMGSAFRPQHELIADLTNGPGRSFAVNGANLISEKRVPRVKKVHPTEKPVALLRELVRVTTPPDGLVVDPFCGSGSMGVACAAEGRRFIGFERDREYAATAERRIAAAV